MSALTINVKINLAECQETAETDNVMKNADGSLSMAINLNDEMNIDIDSHIINFATLSVVGVLQYSFLPLSS